MVNDLSGSVQDGLVIQPRNRITFVEHVYLQSAGEMEPKSISLGFSRLVQSSEQIYERYCKAKQEWTPLDYGWVEKPGITIIVNSEGRFTQAYPTDEERAAAEDRTIEVSLGAPGGGLLISPKESLRFRSSEPDKVRIRCKSGPARYIIYVFPE